MKYFLSVASVVFLLFSGSCLSACQPTPEKDVVVNRGDGVYEARIEEAQQTDRAEPEAHAAPYVFDQRWTDEVVMKNFTVRIDVEVEAPVTGRFPIYTLTPTFFDGSSPHEMALLSQLIGNVVSVRTGGQTKEDYEEMMAAAILGVYDETIGDYIPPSKKELEEQLQLLQQDMQTAPSEADFVPAEEIAPLSIPSDVAYQNADQTVWDIHVEEQLLYVEKRPSGVIQPERWVMAGTAFAGEPAGTVLTNIRIDQDTAEAMVIDFFAAANIGDFKVSNIERARVINGYTGETITEGWSAECARSGGECPAFAYRLYRGGRSLRFTDTAYAAALSPETIQIFVDENGIYSFFWSNPVAVVGLATESVELMPFEQIKEIIRQSIHNSMSWTGDKESGSAFSGAAVTRVLLSYCSVPKINTRDEYYLTPAWFVLLQYDELHAMGASPTAIAFNAVDGSRIDLQATAMP